jgi:DNA-directed RNA polymerase-3 subunit RPC5
MIEIDLDQPDVDPDPIKASYDVYIKPRMRDGRKVYILQFPNRDSKQDYSSANHSQPLELRIKPKAGMLELDVPVDAWRNYDREKGIKWGEAMRQSNMVKGGGSHGMPGGFGIGGAQPGRGRGRGEEDNVINQERLLADYAGAIQREQVLTRQTLGGQAVPKESATPQYMIGAFRKSKRRYLQSLIARKC